MCFFSDFGEPFKTFVQDMNIKVFDNIRTLYKSQNIASRYPQKHEHFHFPYSVSQSIQLWIFLGIQSR